MHTNMASGCFVDAKTCRVLHDELQSGCLCKSKDSFINVFHSFKDFCKEISAQDAVPVEFDGGCSDALLLLCGVMEKVYALSERQMSCGRVCSGLQTTVKYMIEAEKPVIDFLLCLLLESSCEFISYASASALVKFLTASRDETALINTSEKLIRILLDSNEMRYCSKILTFYEKLFISISQSKESTLESFPYYEGCSPVDCSDVATDRRSEMLNNVTQLISFPSLITTIVADLNEKDKLSSMHRILRILVILVETCANVRNQILEDSSALVSMLTNSMSVLIWERTCFVLRQSLDLKSDLMIRMTISDEKLKFSQQFLHQMVTLNIWKQIPCSSEGSFCGFGGIFNSEGASASCVDYLSTVVPVLQSFLLLNMACLATLASVIGKTSGDHQHVLMQEGFLSIQKFIEARVPERYKSTLLTLFENQDDVLVEIMLYTLTVHISLDDLPEIKSVMEEYWNPHFQFNKFLHVIRSDYNVILDLLISEETWFLLYFIKYLKLLLRDSSLCCIQVFPQSTTIKLVAYESSDGSDSDNSFTSNDKKVSAISTNFLRELLKQALPIFHELHSAIQKQVQKNLFPYNGEPLLKLLCEFDRKFRYQEDDVSKTAF